MRGGGGAWMLANLRIRHKLGLLVALPLGAVMALMVPLTAERVEAARSARTTASAALAAREIGALLQGLQQEQLLVLGYLAAPTLERRALVAQMQEATDGAARLLTAPVAGDVVRKASAELDALAAVREQVLARTIDAKSAYDAYRQANRALLDALPLANYPGADAEGVARLAALEELIRSNEEASSAGSLLVAAAGRLIEDTAAITAARLAERQHTEQFAQLVSPDQAALVESVEHGQAGQRFAAMVDAIASGANAPGVTASGTTPTLRVSAVLTAALSYTGLRRFAQDRIAREIADEAQRRARAAVATATGVVAGATGAFAVVLALSVTVSRSIAVPLRRLTEAAAAVAELSRRELVRVADSDSPDPPPPRVAAVDVDAADEIGELAAAMNRVQATAALLLERQVSMRRNVSVMFANIARRTQTLAGRQLALIDELMRTSSHDPRLAPQLDRLGHVATRLRRSADSLLVVSGTIEQSVSSSPTALAHVIDAALADIDNDRMVQVGDVPDIAISSGLVDDLRLLLAELLENATSFSPPDMPVLVTATQDPPAAGGDCRIVIVDHGIGMSAERLAEENRRLVGRERLDVAPTSVLGLFVVGRLARRHGLSVHLEHSDGRGVTATVRVPARLLSAARAAELSSGRLSFVRRRRRRPPLEIEASHTAFDWFRTGRSVGVMKSDGGDRGVDKTAPSDDATVASVNPTNAPGPHSNAEPPSEGAPQGAQPAGLTPAGLVRRVPGAHLAPGLLGAPGSGPAPRWRDPEAERQAMNDYLSGLARSEGRTDQSEPPHHPTVLERQA